MNTRLIVHVASALLCLSSNAALAVSPTVQSLQAQVSALQSQLASLQATVTSQQAKIASLENQTTAVRALNPYVTVDAPDGIHPRALLTGINLQIVNGLGSTETANGLGNLIVGYDLARAGGDPICSDGAYDVGQSNDVAQALCEYFQATWALSHKSGSHYVIIGDYNNYSQYAGLVVGAANTSNRGYASVSGGTNNTATGYFASVSGGYGNTASTEGSSVSGGVLNSVSRASYLSEEAYGSISGGNSNRVFGYAASVSGGLRNTAAGGVASVSGGRDRSATVEAGWVAGSLFEPN